MTTDLLTTLKIPKESVGHGSQAPSPVSVNLKPGSNLFVVGPNGSGKSALLARVGGRVPCHFPELIPTMPNQHRVNNQ